MRRVSGGLVLVAIVGLWLDLAETDALSGLAAVKRDGVPIRGSLDKSQAGPAGVVPVSEGVDSGRQQHADTG